MSEEIKEILEDIKNTEECSLSGKNALFLLDYITNLQQENERLKEENKCIFSKVNDDELLISNAMNYSELKKAEKKVEQLENIIKEAIEYINKNWGHWCSNHCKYATETINILNKGDNNVKDKRLS